MKLYIKYKVNRSCKLTVQKALEKLGLPYRMMGLGAVEIKVHFTPSQFEQFKVVLSKLGLELMDGKNARLVKRIKEIIIDTVDQTEERLKVDFSCYLALQLNQDYTYLANVFSESTGTTIEHYMMTYKIERVKKMLLNDKLNLSGIAGTLNYRSVGHLSNQFKKVTGLTPTVFKQIMYN